MSRSTWACELKWYGYYLLRISPAVTLHVSVWVEILNFRKFHITSNVTLHVSVWVEMFSMIFTRLSILSRSTWACELKWQWCCNAENPWSVTLHVSVWVEIWPIFWYLTQKIVTLHVSVWVEICRVDVTHDASAGHAPRERVSWNNAEQTGTIQVHSHAPRERVSWNQQIVRDLRKAGSHAPRERVSWNHMWPCCHRILIGHAPRERVSWNCKILNLLLTNVVTLHVSVWVEMTKL